MPLPAILVAAERRLENKLDLARSWQSEFTACQNQAPERSRQPEMKWAKCNKMKQSRKKGLYFGQNSKSKSTK